MSENNENTVVQRYFCNKWALGALDLNARAHRWSFERSEEQSACFEQSLVMTKSADSARVAIRSAVLEALNPERQKTIYALIEHIEILRKRGASEVGALTEHYLDDSLSLINSLQSEFKHLSSDEATFQKQAKERLIQHFTREISAVFDVNTVDDGGRAIQKRTTRRIPFSQGMLPEEAKALDVIARRFSKRTLYKSATACFADHLAEVQMEALGIYLKMKAEFDPHKIDNFLPYLFSFLPKKLYDKDSLKAVQESSFDEMLEQFFDSDLCVDDIMGRLLFDMETPSENSELPTTQFERQQLIKIVNEHLEWLDKEDAKAALAWRLYVYEEMTLDEIGKRLNLTPQAVRARMYTLKAAKLFISRLNKVFLK